MSSKEEFTEFYSVNDGAGAAVSIAMKALVPFLDNGFDFLTVGDLGSLSICNKALLKLTQNQWKVIWERYVEVGREFQTPTSARESSDEFNTETWMGETSLLSCFVDPVRAKECGYKRAAGMLSSKVCTKCGGMSAAAHPLLLERICSSCSRNDQDLWLIAKAKAKETFILSEGDMKSLRGVVIPIKSNGPKASPSMVYLLNDVVRAAFAKHGGDADGLAAAINRKQQKAIENYNKRLKTDKPMKKMPKVTHHSTRPADNLLAVKWCVCIPRDGCVTSRTRQLVPNA